MFKSISLLDGTETSTLGTFCNISCNICGIDDGVATADDNGNVGIGGNDVDNNTGADVVDTNDTDGNVVDGNDTNDDVDVNEQDWIRSVGLT